MSSFYAAIVALEVEMDLTNDEEHKEEILDALHVLRHYERWEPMIKAAGRVDMVSEAIEELSKNNLRYCHVIALLSSLPAAKEADHD